MKPARAPGRRRRRALGRARTAACIAAWSTALAGLALAADDNGLARGLAALRLNDQRAAAVSHRLRLANRDLCPRRSPLFGWTLHSAAQYSPRVRQSAQQYFKLKGDFPAILGLAPDGPAAAAGLRLDDILLEANGVPLGRTEVTGPATYGPIEAAIGALIREAGGPMVLLVERGGVRRHVRLEGRPGCAYETQVDPSPDLQASADAQRVFISSSLVDFAANDDELAAILGHEYAHIILGHPPDPNAPRRAVGGKVPHQRTANQELAADRLGLRLALRAGYDVRAAPRILERLGRSRPWLRLLPSNHPSLGDRRKRMLIEIERLLMEPGEATEGAPAAATQGRDRSSHRG